MIIVLSVRLSDRISVDWVPDLLGVSGCTEALTSQWFSVIRLKIVEERFVKWTANAFIF